MSEENTKPKDPMDFEIPHSYRPLGREELERASESPELRDKIRFFAEQMNDVFVKGEETPEEQAFLQACRDDSKAFRKALEKKIRAVAEELKDDSGVASFVFEQLRCSNTRNNKGGFVFSVEIRPLFFTSLLEREEKAGKRYSSQNRYTVFFHVDQHHTFQMTRFVEPTGYAPAYHHVMQGVLSVLSGETMKPILEQHYGDWEMVSKKIVALMLESLKMQK